MYTARGTPAMFSYYGLVVDRLSNSVPNYELRCLSSSSLYRKY